MEKRNGDHENVKITEIKIAIVVSNLFSTRRCILGPLRSFLPEEGKKRVTNPSVYWALLLFKKKQQ